MHQDPVRAFRDLVYVVESLRGFEVLLVRVVPPPSAPEL